MIWALVDDWPDPHDDPRAWWTEPAITDLVVYPDDPEPPHVLYGADGEVLIPARSTIPFGFQPPSDAP